MSITSAISAGYQSLMSASDRLNADKLANRLVELGYNTGGNRLGGLVGAGLGVSASVGATTVLLDKMSPIDTLFHEMPKSVAEQTGFAHQAVEVAGKILEAGAETALLALTVNFGLQSVDAAIDMIAKTGKRSLHLKDDAPRPRTIQLDDTRRT